MKKHIILPALLFFCCIICSSAQARMQAFPPSWWLNMENDTLHLIIYDATGFKKPPKFQGSAKWIESKAAPDKRYYFMSFIIPSMVNGEGFIEIINGGNSVRIPLKERAKRKLPGISQRDAMYLITPDRFANGDPANDQLPMKEELYGREHPFGRHGGDIQGITNHLDYINKLGFNTLWISPLLVNDQPEESYHGYAITDHFNIDPRFGKMDDFAILIKEMKKRKMKMVMDMVYNHVGTQHLFFREIPDSGFFNFHPEAEDGFIQTNYRAVTLMDPHASDRDRHTFSDGWFVKHMPDLNQRNPWVASYLIQNSLWWIEEFGIESYRIDTYTYPDQRFMKKLVRAIKTEYPEFFIFGETWVPFPEVQAYFTEDFSFNPNAAAMDGVTDFQFYYGMLEAINNTQGWTSGVAGLYYRMASDYLYKHPENNVIFLDNHDLARIYGVVGENRQKLKSVLSILFTMRGIPCMYYGTEILMKETANHGLIREDFPGGWPSDSLDKFGPAGRNQAENEVFEHIQKLLAWRSTSEAISRGRMIHFTPHNDVYVFARYTDNDVVLVLFNAQPEEIRTVNLDEFAEIWPRESRGLNLLTDQILPGNDVQIPPSGVIILQKLQ